MLRIYNTALDIIRQLRGLLEILKRKDANLEDQLRRAATSVVLNIAEGSDSRGKNRQARYNSALGSIREVKACLDAGLAFDYFVSVDAKILRDVNHVTAVLVKLLHG